MSSLYKNSGVDIDLGNEIVNHLKENKMDKGYTLSEIGGFAAMTSLPPGMKEPIIITSCDGVGTKLKIAQEMGGLSSIGIDLVAMSVNDIICSGAKPLSFLDTLSFSDLRPSELISILSGIQKGCELAECPLVGGETAQLPGVFEKGDFDLVGFAMGVVEKKKIITPERVREGDVVIGLSSSGVHSNGFSLVRKIIEENDIDISSPFSDLHMEYKGTQTLGQVLLTPTKIYSHLILNLLREFDSFIHGIAHITGGGLTENIPRILPKNMKVKIDLGTWNFPEIFNWIRDEGTVSDEEMFRVFNMGIGMVLLVDKEQASAIVKYIDSYYIDLYFDENSIGLPIGSVEAINPQPSVYYV
jgi:phosphoribosylformylglycinamidine cyclo-ligase